MSNLGQAEWSEIEQRVRTVLSSAGIVVRDVHKNVAGGSVMDPYLAKLIGHAPHGRGYGLDDHSYLCVHVPVNCRTRARNAIVAELGPDFVARYHTHWQSSPQNAVFVFAADRVWPEQVFKERGPLPYEPGADRMPKPRRERTVR